MSRRLIPAAEEKTEQVPLGSVGPAMREWLVGQDAAIDAISQRVDVFRAGLNDAERPVGVFLLHGPTGCGKTRTAEVLAQVLHGSDKKLVKIDCAELGLDHETAKLTGSPPGYLGHRETPGMITQARLAGVTTDRSDISVVLFDEVEKGSRRLKEILLGVLDKAVMTLGDNTRVNFDKAVVFFTSNVGAEEIARNLAGGTGFPGASSRSHGTSALKKSFSPEFLNRLDATLSYSALTRAQLDEVLSTLLIDIQSRVVNARAEKAFVVDVSREARDVLLDRGTSAVYGARELRRTVQKLISLPLATMILAGGDSLSKKLVRIGAAADDLTFEAVDAEISDLLKASIMTAEWRKRKAA